MPGERAHWNPAVVGAPLQALREGGLKEYRGMVLLWFWRPVDRYFDQSQKDEQDASGALCAETFVTRLLH